MINIKDGHDGKTIDKMEKDALEKCLYDFIKWNKIKKNFSSKKPVVFDGSIEPVGYAFSKIPHLPQNNSEAIIIKYPELFYHFAYESLQHYIKGCMYFLSGMNSWSNNFMMPGEVLLYYSKFFSIIGLSQLQLKSIVNVNAQNKRESYKINCIDSNDGIFLIKKLSRGSPHKNWWYVFYKAFKNNIEEDYQCLWRNIKDEGFLDTCYRNDVNYSPKIANDEIHYAKDFLKDSLSAYNIPVFDDDINLAELAEVYPDTFFPVEYIRYFTDKILQVVPCPPMDYKSFHFRQFKSFLENIPNKYESIKSFQNFFNRKFFKKDGKGKHITS